MEKYKKAKLNDRENDLTKQWYVEYMYKHPEKGVMVPFRKYLSLKLKTGVARRMKADQLIGEINEWLAMGGDPFAHESLGKTRVMEALERVLALKKAVTRHRTYTSYKHTITKFETFLSTRKILDLAVDDVSNTVAQQFSDYMVLNNGIGNRTHNNMIANMGAIWKMMMKRFNIRINPWITIERLPEEEPSLVTYSEKDLEIVSTVLPKEDFDLWICACLVFYCALRPQEIVRLQAYNIHLDKGAILLDGRITKNKKSKWVNIPSDDFIEDLAKMHLERINPEWHIFSTHLKPGKHEIAPTRIAERWRQWADKHGIKRGIYDLKHNAAGMASEAGMNLRDLQMHLRHHSLEQTEKYINRFRREASPGFNEKYPKFNSRG